MPVMHSPFITAACVSQLKLKSSADGTLYFAIKRIGIKRMKRKIRTRKKNKTVKSVAVQKFIHDLISPVFQRYRRQFVQ